MPHIDIEKRVEKFIKSLLPKHQNQIKKSILSLESNPPPNDSQVLKGYTYRRLDCGEYRIIYRIDITQQIVYVVLVGKRNGGEVYKKLKNITSS